MFKNRTVKTTARSTPPSHPQAAYHLDTETRRTDESPGVPRKAGYN